MHRIQNIIGRSIVQLFPKNKKPVLGRWSIEHCDKRLNAKIDLSNEDHCGPCGQYILDKTIKSVNVHNQIK
jgi:hypothetical protein